MTLTENPHFLRAFKDYMEARKMVKQGLLGNAHNQRTALLITYRLLAGKPL